MPITVANFRDLFPEFSDSSVYLDERIEPWLTLAQTMLPASRWRNLYTMGVSLFVGHYLTLGRQAELTASRGGAPGIGLGVLTSKSINGVSAGYNTQLAALRDGGDWNLTTYGVRFLSFARMIGSGGVIVVGNDAALVLEGSLTSGAFNQPQ